MKESVCAIIVTYGKRFHHLFQVVESCFENRVSKIIIVDNNSKDREKIKELATKNSGKIIHVENFRNLGASGGFKIGIEEALKCEDCEFLLLLDDDNKVGNGTVETLLSAYKELVGKFGDNIILRCYRPNIEGLLDVLRQTKLRENNYAGFSLKDIPLKIYKAILPSGYLTHGRFKNEILEVSNVGWGGMFFNKHLILRNNLYPNSEMILYYDDIEFSYRAIKNGIRIFFIKDAIIYDLERPHGGGSIFALFNLSLGSPSRIYYALRNIEYVERYVKPGKKSFIWNINRWVYLNLLKIVSILGGKLENYKTIKEAINDGKNKKLGYNEKYRLE